MYSWCSVVQFSIPRARTQVRSRAINRLAELQTAGNVAEQTKAAPAPRHLKKLNPDAAVGASLHSCT